MAEHNDIGAIGEEIAAKTLRRKWLRIRERNWRRGHLEVDIIAESRKEIIFAEVKTRTGTWGGKTPAEYVDDAKKRHMVAAANAYVRQHGIEKYVRLDVVGVLLDAETHEAVEVTHYENAFLPPVRTVGNEAPPSKRRAPRKW